jgi:hypothetical protein
VVKELKKMTTLAQYGEQAVALAFPFRSAWQNLMKAFHHPGDSQQAFLTGLAHLYNLILYQRRAMHAGQCGVEVEGGRVPTSDWMLNLQILTSGGFR